MTRHTRIAPVRRFLVLALASSIALGACSDTEKKPLPNYRDELLSSDQVGQGTIAHPDDYDPGPATACGPDKFDNLPLHYEKEPNYVSYTQGRRDVDLGVWDGLEASFQRNLEGMRQDLEGDACRLGKAYHGYTGTEGHEDWRIETLDFGEGIVAFRSVQWRARGNGPLPLSPKERDDIYANSSARAYGLVGGKLVMVRIDDTTVEPPSEAELRALWNAQTGKVLYLGGLEGSKELLTPQSEQADK